MFGFNIYFWVSYFTRLCSVRKGRCPLPVVILFLFWFSYTLDVSPKSCM